MRDQESTPKKTDQKPKRRWRRRLLKYGGFSAVAIGGLLALGSCIRIPTHNPAYTTTVEEARDALDEMRDRMVALERPVLVLSGYRSPKTNANQLRRDILKVTGSEPEMVATLSYPFADDIEPIGEKVVDFVESNWPSDDPKWTREIDVVAISMGGLVARTASLPPEDRGSDPDTKRLKINTLYTFATPHRGARLSEIIRPDAAAKQMHPNSDFIASLNGAFADADYTVVPYAVLMDRWVGATNAAPPGQEPVWISGRVVFSHHLMTTEPKLLADLSRRLRNEKPLGGPGAPPRD